MRALNYSNSLKVNDKVDTENVSKTNPKAVSKAKATMAQGKKDLASKRNTNEKLDPIANRKNTKASNSKGNSNRPLAQNHNDVHVEPLRGKIRPLSSSTLALSRAANSIGSSAEHTSGSVARGGSRAKSAGSHRIEFGSEECKRRSKGMVALHTELFSNNSFSMHSSLLVVLFAESSTSKHDLLELIVKVHDIITSEELYFSLSTKEYTGLLESICAVFPMRQMEIRSLFRPHSSDWWAKNISNWLVRSDQLILGEKENKKFKGTGTENSLFLFAADIKKVEVYVKKELQLSEEYNADDIVGTIGNENIDTTISSPHGDAEKEEEFIVQAESHANLDSEVEWTSELFHQGPIDEEEVEADEPFQQLYMHDSANGLGFEPPSSAVDQSSYGDDFEQKDSVLKVSVHQQVSYGEDFENDYSVVIVKEEKTNGKSLLVPIEEYKAEEAIAVARNPIEEYRTEDESAIAVKAAAAADKIPSQGNENRADLASVENLDKDNGIGTAIQKDVTASLSSQLGFQNTAVDYEEEFERESQHVHDGVNDNDSEDKYEQDFSPPESVKKIEDGAVYQLLPDDRAEMKHETASVGSGYGSYGEDFDNEAFQAPNCEKSVENEYKDDGSDDYAADKPESEEENDELGYVNAPLQETSQIRYGEDFENENGSSIMKSYGFTMSSSMLEVENETDSAIMMRAAPYVPGALMHGTYNSLAPFYSFCQALTNILVNDAGMSTSDRSDNSFTPLAQVNSFQAGVPSAKSNPLDSANDDYSAYSKDVSANVMFFLQY